MASGSTTRSAVQVRGCCCGRVVVLACLTCSSAVLRSTGYLAFEHDGKKLTLDVIDEDGEPDRYWIMFKGEALVAWLCTVALTHIST
jgi:hypothetical protein